MYVQGAEANGGRDDSQPNTCIETPCTEGYVFQPVPLCRCIKLEDAPRAPSAGQQAVSPVTFLPNTPFPAPTELGTRRIPFPGVFPPQASFVVDPFRQVPRQNCRGIIQQCRPGQVFDEQTCRCHACFQQRQCLFQFQVFNPITCQCEPQSCLNRCNRCERQNPATCACEPLITCPRGQVLDTDVCRCFCLHSFRCNELQQFNTQTCQCECVIFISTLNQLFIPEQVGPSTFLSVLPSVFTERTAGRTGRRSGSRRGRRRGTRGALHGQVHDQKENINPNALVDYKLKKGRRRRSQTGTASGNAQQSDSGTTLTGVQAFGPTRRNPLGTILPRFTRFGSIIPRNPPLLGSARVRNNFFIPDFQRPRTRTDSTFRSGQFSRGRTQFLNTLLSQSAARNTQSLAQYVRVCPTGQIPNQFSCRCN